MRDTVEDLEHVVDDAKLDHGFVHDILDGGSGAGVDVKHFVDHFPEAFGVGWADGGEGTFKDFEGEAVHGLGVEGVAEVAHFVEAAAHGPDIAFVGVGLVFEELGAHVVGGSDAGVGKVARGVEDLGDAEVAEADAAIFEEDVLRFEVAVEDLLLMKVEEGEGHLGEPVDDLRLGEAFLVSNFLVNVASLAVDHDDVEILLAVEEGVLVGDDVGVAELLEEADLVLGVLAVLLGHVPDFDALDDVEAVFALVPG